MKIEKERDDLILAWKVLYGYEWVDWDTIMRLKAEMWSNHTLANYGVNDMIQEGYVERDIRHLYLTKVRLVKSEPVSVK